MEKDRSFLSVSGAIGNFKLGFISKLLHLSLTSVTIASEIEHNSYICKLLVKVLLN